VVRAVIGVAAALVLLVAPSSGMAQSPLPVGEAHGVRIVREKGAIVVVFTKRAAKRYQRIAGRLVEVDCTDQQPREPGPPRAYAFLSPPDPGEITAESGGGVTMRAPKRGRKLVTGDLTSASQSSAPANSLDAYDDAVGTTAVLLGSDNPRAFRPLSVAASGAPVTASAGLRVG
jgi:hypothetical protein